MCPGHAGEHSALTLTTKVASDGRGLSVSASLTKSINIDFQPGREVPPISTSMNIRLLACVSTLVCSVCFAQPSICELILTPDYRLPRRAGDLPRALPDPAGPGPINSSLEAIVPPVIFQGQQPNHRILEFPCDGEFPVEQFTIEVWIIDHVNQPVGMAVGSFQHENPGKSGTILTYWDRSVEATLNSDSWKETITLRAESEQPYKKLFHHLALTYDGKDAALLINGDVVRKEKTPGGPIAENGLLELAGYLENEPYMELANLVKEVRIHDKPLSPAELKERFQRLASMADEGIFFEDLFHFNAQPYLHFVTKTSVNLVWETDLASTAVIHYGLQEPLENVIEVTHPRRLQEVTIDGLQEETPYFYEVVVTNAAGESLNSGILSFRTAPRDETSYRFAVFADTEARPHINHQISKLIWGDRPDFAMNFGDLTDGGFEDRKFEWNYEYFLGMGALHSRVPIFTVPGNGDSDLYWYSRYHKYPGKENFYWFDYGNARFFMLDSNQPMGPDSEQYQWLESELEKTGTEWIFAGHHHPAYTSDEDDYGNTWRGTSFFGDKNVRGILELYEKYGVDMVFYGHLHSYERTFPLLQGEVNESRGVYYIQCGGAGGNLEDFAPARRSFSRKTYPGHHYGLIAIHGSRLEFQMIDSEGRLRDSFTIER